MNSANKTFAQIIHENSATFNESGVRSGLSQEWSICEIWINLFYQKTESKALQILFARIFHSIHDTHPFLAKIKRKIEKKIERVLVVSFFPIKSLSHLIKIELPPFVESVVVESVFFMYLVSPALSNSWPLDSIRPESSWTSKHSCYTIKPDWRFGVSVSSIWCISDNFSRIWNGIVFTVEDLAWSCDWSSILIRYLSKEIFSI